MSIDLSTTYLGLQLKNPLVAAASPLTSNLEALQKLEQGGAAAVVLPSLFEEQIEHDEQEVDRLYESHADSFAESLSMFPELDSYNTGTSEYLTKLEQTKQALQIPVIGSLNGSSKGGWTDCARSMQTAGADAIELNIYFVPTDPEMTAEQVDQHYTDLVASVTESVTIPVCVKIGPFFTSLPYVVRSLCEAGAAGVVLFNRYLEPDIDLETLQIAPNLVLSNRHELRLALRWIAILRDQTPVSLAASGGVHFSEDVLKAVLAGADVTQLATALLRYGPAYLGKVLEEIRHWMEENEYASIEQMKGSMSRRNCPDPSALERANYMRALTTFTSNYSAG